MLSEFNKIDAFLRQIMTRECMGCSDDMEIEALHEKCGIDCGHNDNSKCRECSQSCWRVGAFCRHQWYCVHCRELCVVCSRVQKKKRMSERGLVGQCTRCHKDFYYENENDKQSRLKCPWCEHCNEFKCLFCHENALGTKHQTHCKKCMDLKKIIIGRKLPDDLANPDFDLAVVYFAKDDDHYNPYEYVLIERHVMFRFPLYKGFSQDDFDGDNKLVKKLDYLKYLYQINLCRDMHEYCGCLIDYDIRCAYKIPKDMSPEQCTDIIKRKV